MFIFRRRHKREVLKDYPDYNSARFRPPRYRLRYYTLIVVVLIMSLFVWRSAHAWGPDTHANRVPTLQKVQAKTCLQRLAPLTGAVVESVP